MGEQQLRELGIEAGLLLDRAVHLERRAARTRFGSNERSKLDADALQLRARASVLHAQISELAREETAG